MKAILEFNLPEEQEEFQDCINGFKWSCLVGQLDNELRTRTKYASDDTPDEVVAALVEIREYLRVLLSEEGLIL
jgi:hypothetical protein